MRAISSAPVWCSLVIPGIPGIERMLWPVMPGVEVGWPQALSQPVMGS